MNMGYGSERIEDTRHARGGTAGSTGGDDGGGEVPVRCSSCNKPRPQNCQKKWTICNACVLKRKRKRDADQRGQLLDHFTTEFSCVDCRDHKAKLCPIHFNKLQRMLRDNHTSKTDDDDDVDDVNDVEPLLPLKGILSSRGGEKETGVESLFDLQQLEAHTFFTKENHNDNNNNNTRKEEEEGKIRFKDCFIRVPPQQRELLMAIENMAAKLVENQKQQVVEISKSFNQYLDPVLLLLISQITEEVLEERLKEEAQEG